MTGTAPQPIPPQYQKPDLLQQFEKLVSGDSSVGEDAAEGAALDILRVDGDRDDVPTLGVREVVVAALRASERAPSPSARGPGPTVGGEPTAAVRSRGDGDPLDQCWLR